MPVTINGNLYNESDFIGSNHATKFAAYAYDLFDSITNPLATGVESLFAQSSSTVVFGVGNRAFNVPAGKGFYPGMSVVARADTGTGFLGAQYGRVLSYTGTLLTIVVSSVTERVGTQANSWVIGPSSVGEVLTSFGLTEGGSGQTTADAAWGALDLPKYDVRPEQFEDFAGLVLDAYPMSGFPIREQRTHTAQTSVNGSVFGGVSGPNNRKVPALSSHPGVVTLAVSGETSVAAVTLCKEGVQTFTDETGMYVEIMFYLEQLPTVDQQFSLFVGMFFNYAAALTSMLNATYADSNKGAHVVFSGFPMKAHLWLGSLLVGEVPWDGKKGWLRVNLRVTDSATRTVEGSIANHTSRTQYAGISGVMPISGSAWDRMYTPGVRLQKTLGSLSSSQFNVVLDYIHVGHEQANVAR